MIDGFNLGIGLVMEECFSIIRSAAQLFLLVVSQTFAAKFVNRLRYDIHAWFVDDDFLAHEVTLGADAQQTTEQIFVCFEIEHHRVEIGLIGNKYAERGNYEGANPHTHDHVDRAFAGHLHARGTDHIPNNENDYGDNRRHTKTALTNDGAKGGTDEEEENAGEREGHLLMPFDPVAANVVIAVARDHLLPLQIGLHGLDAGTRHLPCAQRLG